jgi:O-antigen ligase
MKKIINLENLIYLTILLLPSYLIKVNFFVFSLNFLDVLILTDIFFWLFFCKKKNELKAFYLRQKKILWSSGLIFFGFIFAALFNKNYFETAGILKSWVFLPFIFSLIAGSMLNKKQKEKIFSIYYLSAFLVATTSLIYFFLGKITYDGRLESIFNSPNYLAMYLAPAFFIAYFGKTVDRLNLKNEKKWLLLSLAPITLSTYLTYSYGAWLSILASFLIIILWKKKNFAKNIFILLIGILIIFLSQQRKNKFLDLLLLNPRSSFFSRLMIWRSAEKILCDNFFWGIGIGNFQNKYLAYQKYFQPYLEWAVPHPHNLYLAFWLYSGIIGFIGFALLLFFWVRTTLKKETDDSLKLLSLALMSYFLLHGIIDTTYFKNDLAVMFWLLINLI